MDDNAKRVIHIITEQIKHLELLRNELDPPLLKKLYPDTESVTTHEGGVWIPFEQFNGETIHSIRFVNGTEWDTRNGWRKHTEESRA